MSLFNHEEPYVTISVYPGTKKIMIQPSLSNEEKLKMWLREFRSILERVKSVN